MSTASITFKVVLVGEGAVGKTALRERYLGRGFKGKYTMTIGADFALKRVMLDGTQFVTQIWDLAGQSGFTSVRSMYYHGAMAGLLVFDINRPSTLEKLDEWTREIRRNRGTSIPLVLIGNKSDLREEGQHQISREKALEYAQELETKIGYEVPYVETSALHGSNVDKAFLTMIKIVKGIIDEDQINK